MHISHAYEGFQTHRATRRTNHACQSFGECVDVIVLIRASRVVTQLDTLVSLEGGTSGVFHSHRPRQAKVNKKINDDEFTAKIQDSPSQAKSCMQKNKMHAQNIFAGPKIAI